MSDIAFEILEGAIKEMERAHLGIDAMFMRWSRKHCISPTAMSAKMPRKG